MSPHCRRTHRDGYYLRESKREILLAKVLQRNQRRYIYLAQTIHWTIDYFTEFFEKDVRTKPLITWNAPMKRTEYFIH